MKCVRVNHVLPGFPYGDLWGAELTMLMDAGLTCPSAASFP